MQLVWGDLSKLLLAAFLGFKYWRGKRANQG